MTASSSPPSSSTTSSSQVAANEFARGLAGIVAERAADVLRARHGVTALQFPGLAAESGRLAALLDDASLLRILDGAARLRLFLERNVKEDIALEAGCLALARS